MKKKIFLICSLVVMMVCSMAFMYKSNKLDLNYTNKAYALEKVVDSKSANNIKLYAKTTALDSSKSISLFEQLKTEIANATEATTIELPGGEYLFTDTLVIDKKITLVSKGSVQFKRDQAFKKTMINILETGSLGIKANEDLIFDGQKQSPTNRISGASFIYTKGELIIDGAIFQNDFGNKQGAMYAPIKAGKKGKIIFDKGVIKDNDYSGQSSAYSAGAIFLEDDSSLVMNGGSILNNQASNYSIQGYSVWSDSPGAGGIFVDHGASFIMNDGLISGNKGWAGGVMVGSADPYIYNRSTSNEAQLNKKALATAIFNGGTIKENQAVGGGGISGNGNVDITIPASTKLLVTKNRAYAGGGILVSDWYVNGLGLDKTMGKVSIDTWNKFYKGKLVMAGGTVSENYASSCGGGIDISSNGVYLTGGKIIGNSTASYGLAQGGGVYLTTVPYTLHIENALISENSSQNGSPFASDGYVLYGGTGGGVWFCPTGSATFYAENGVVIANNKAVNSADDFFSSGKVNSNYTVTLPTRTSLGSKISYYRDVQNNRYSNKKELVDESELKGNSKNLSLHNEVEELETIKQGSKLIISNNKSPRGGGLGSNGNVVFGKEPGVDLVVEKTWGTGTNQKEVEIEVRAKFTKANKEHDYLIEKVKLNKDNNFKVTLKELPKQILGKDIKDIIYLKELNNQDYKVSVSPITEPKVVEKLSFKLNRPEFSDESGNIHAAYQFVQENQEGKVVIKYNLKKIDGNQEIDLGSQTMTLDRNTFEYKGTVSFKDIELDSKDVEVEYYLDHQANGDYYFSDSLVEYSLELKKVDGKWKLRIPRIMPTKDQDTYKYTFKEKVLKVESLDVKAGKLPYVIKINNEQKAKLIVKGKKIWQDNQDKDKIRPTTIKVHLLEDGIDTGKVVEVSQATNWEYKFENLPVEKDGKKIVYSVFEEKVDKYQTFIHGYDIVNTYTPYIPPKTPNEKPKVNSGDDAKTLLYISLMGLGLFGFIVFKYRFIKNKAY